MSDNTDHLKVTVTNRGFKHLPPIPGTYGGEVRVYESSAALDPHIWLNVVCPVNLNDLEGSKTDVAIHLTIEDANRLADQLQYLVRNHYQVTSE